jgi:hypothetical protein
VYRTRGSRWLPAIVVVLLLPLAGCSDSSAPSDDAMTETDVNDVADALADESDQALQTVPFHHYACAEVSGSGDSDGDGTPDEVTFTWALPACSFTGFRGGELEITGTMVVSDRTPSAPDFDFEASLDDLTWRLTSPNDRWSYTAVRNGSRVITGSAAGFSVSNTVTVERTYPVRAPGTVSHNLLLSFTPADGETLEVGEPLPDGTFTKSGTFTWSRHGRSRTFTVTTTAPLEWDASCTTDRKIVAGEIRAALPNGSYIRTVWTGCGEEPTRSFVPAG